MVSRGGSDPKEELRKNVKALVQEYKLAMAYHETWRVAAEDVRLHKCLSHSFAGNTFLIVREVLRRETLLAMFRIWDTRTETINISSIAGGLEDPKLLSCFGKNWSTLTRYTSPRRKLRG